VIGSKGSVNDAELWPNQSVPAVDEGTESLALAALPPLMGLRYMATMLRADAIVAGNAGDSKRLLQDIHSTLSLSKQVGKDAPLLLGLMSIAISEMAIEDVERTLREHPTLIRKEELIELSRRLSSPKVAADLFSLDAERMSFDDMLQRAYTDDGSGSGRLTSEALTDYALFDYPPRKSRWWETAAQPAISLLAPSRRKFKEEYTQGMDMAESNLKLALREANWPGAHEVPLSPFSAAWAMPSLHRSQDGAERTLGHRDGVVTGIALELYRREHGNYPDSLDALVPELLPEVPIDRITGAPVRYGRVDGRPVVYSVGPDRKDDNGREPDPPKRAGYWDANPEVMPDGDWVLYTTLKR
jgi:hypothetical protein